MKKQYTICIQCKDSISGKTGSFLVERGSKPPFKAVSPVFPSFLELIRYIDKKYERVGFENTNPYFTIYETKQNACL